MTKIIDFKERQMELFSDDFIDTTFDSFVNALRRDFQSYENGDLSFEYVDNLHGTEEYVDDSGDPKQEKVKLAGMYNARTDKIKIDKKYKGNDPETLAIYAHEAAHKHQPNEGNEDLLDVYAGLALRELSNDYTLAADALKEWKKNWNARKKEAIREDGLDAWNQRISRVYDRVGDSGYLGERHKKEENSRSGGLGETLIGAGFAALTPAKDFLKSYLGYEPFTQAEKVTNEFYRTGKSVWKEYVIENLENVKVAEEAAIKAANAKKAA